MKLKGLSSRNIQLLLKNGRRLYSSGYILFYFSSIKKNDNVLNISIIVKKSFGKAVYRNKRKRRLKSIIRNFFKNFNLKNKVFFEKIILMDLRKDTATKFFMIKNLIEKLFIKALTEIK